MRGLFLATAAVAALVLGAGFWWMAQGPEAASPGAPETVVVPELSATARAGAAAFAENCATCHGENAGGTDRGPPLVHRIYEPGHHGDMAFLLAVQRGVRAHHWRFGDMPPVEGVSQDEAREIVAYVRELQRANGIR